MSLGAVPESTSQFVRRLVWLTLLQNAGFSDDPARRQLRGIFGFGWGGHPRRCRLRAARRGPVGFGAGVGEQREEPVKGEEAADPDVVEEGFAVAATPNAVVSA